MVIAAPSSPKVKGLFTRVFHKGRSEPTTSVAAVIADEADPRMLAQLTAFTVHATPKPLESFDNSDRWLMRFEIPAAARQALRRELWRHGIRRSTLFPDLTNLAAELKAMVPKKPKFAPESTDDAGD